MALLGAALRLLEERNYQVVNVDATIVCEVPKLAPHAAAMRARLAATLGIAPAAVSVKAKTNEGMGWIGRGEGIAVVAVALIDSVEPLPEP
jgi:2-C-methyl-D-erythritol 2,4-cyclodiphosphate synthase